VLSVPSIKDTHTNGTVRVMQNMDNSVQGGEFSAYMDIRKVAASADFINWRWWDCTDELSYLAEMFIKAGYNANCLYIWMLARMA